MFVNSKLPGFDVEKKNEEVVDHIIIVCGCILSGLELNNKYM